MNRLEKLRESTVNTEHAQVRICMPEEWNTSAEPGSLPERKALAIKMIFEEMPLYIGENELIVGTRSIYGRTSETGLNMSCFDYNAMPHYVNDEDRKLFGFDQEYLSKAHYAPDFGIVLDSGIDALIEEAKRLEAQSDLEETRNFAASVRIAYEGLADLIRRYAAYAGELAEKTMGERVEELKKIAKGCAHIAGDSPADLQEACQLVWFLYLGCIIENFQFINYGRIDQVLAPYIKDETDDEIREIMGCLLLKMYDQYDLVLANKNLMGKYSAQHNITIGGLTRDGKDSCSRVTKGILEAAKITRLPEPLISVRVNEKNPFWFLHGVAELSVSGLNSMAYYNDSVVIDNLHKAGLKIEDARDYAFGLCQDILIQGRGDHYCSGGVNLTYMLLDTLEECSERDDVDYETFVAAYKRKIAETIDHNLDAWNNWEEAVREWNRGNRELFLERVRSGVIDPFEPALGIGDAQAAAQESEEDAGENQKKELYIQSLMSPLPITSALYHGCMKNGVDITRCGCENADKGVMILGPVIAFNGLAALKLRVFEEKRYTLKEVWQALQDNWEGHGEMRSRMWTAPKWCNDNDYVDQDAAAIAKFAGDHIRLHRTPGGGVHLSGIHQPHPVFAGRNIMATPEGRFAGTPIPVSLSPENGTLEEGPTAGMKSAAKIPHSSLEWNSCLMLQYYASTFAEEDGADKFAELLLAYFKLGGIQHQPNIVDPAALRDAQVHPERYKDLIIRMWGVSAHFVDLPRDVQDEFIARFE